MEQHFEHLAAAMYHLTTSINKQDVDIATMHIEKFDGTTTKYNAWMKNLERYFRLKSIDDDQKKINIAMTTSEGSAADFIDWWLDNNEPPVQTFELLQTKFEKGF